MSVTTEADESLAFLRDLHPLHRRRARWQTQTLQLALRLTEVLVFFLVAVAVAAVFSFWNETVPSLWGLLAACFATVAAIETGRPRRTNRPRRMTLALQALAASLTGIVVLLIAGVPWRVDVSWGLAESVGAATLLAVVHYIYSRVVDTLLSRGRLATHVAIVGSGPASHRLQAKLESCDPLAVKVVGRYALDDAAPLEGARGTLRTLLSDCRLEFVDAIVLAPEPDDAVSFGRLRCSLNACTQDLYVLPEAAFHFAGLQLDSISAIGTSNFVLLSRRPVSGSAAFVKRSFDFLGSLALLLFMAPLLGFLAVAITLDSRGPVLFRQLRVGYNNQLFYILKFRSMRDDVTDRLAKQQTVRGDKRVTRVGRIIRRLSLDELPQLLNVLRGEMSLVGPRPHAPGTSIGGQRVHTVVDDYARRHLVRPGITGLAQVRGLRGGLQDRKQVADRLAADLEYIERWSIWLDVRILFGTVLLELRSSRGC